MIFNVKSFFYSLLIFGSSFFVISEFVIDIPVINDKFRHVVANQLSKTFNRDITIESISGGLTSNLIMENVTISSLDDSSGVAMATVDKMIVELSLSAFLGDFSKGIQDITFDGVTLNVIRSKDKKINIFEFVKLKGQPSSSLFSGTLNFTNIKGVFYDYLGWKKQPSSFEQSFKNGRGQIIFQKNSTVNLNFSLFFSDATTQLDIEGEVKGKDFFYDFSVDQLYLERWGPYLLPSKYFYIQDDFVSVKGTLYRSLDVDYSTFKVPFNYSIDVGFDYLTYKQKNMPYPIQNLNGRILLSNEDDSVLYIDALRGEIEQIPVEIDGYIYFDKKQYDVNLSSTDPISLNNLFDNFNIKNQIPLSTNLNIDVSVNGSFNVPLITTNLFSESVKFDNYSLGRFDVQLLTSRRRTTVKSLDKSDIKIGGILRKRSLNLDIALDSLQFPLFDMPKPIQLNFSGPYSQPNINLKLNDFGYDLFGYKVEEIVASMNMVKNSLAISNLVVGLDNTQKVSYSGNYKFDEKFLYLDQESISISSGNVSRKLTDIDSEISLKYDKEKWRLDLNADVEGDYATVYGLELDYFKVSFDKQDEIINVKIDSLEKGDQYLTGSIQSRFGDLYSSNLKLDNVQLKNMTILFPQISKFDLDGIASGILEYTSGNDGSFYSGQVTVIDFNTVYGQFGDMTLDYIYSKNVFSIKSLSLSKIHNANLSGEYINEDNFNIRFNNASFLRLDAFNYFSQRKLFGGVELNGTLSKTLDGFFYDGYLESEQLEFDSHKLDYLFADIDIFKDRINVNNSRLLFEDGEINAKGSITNIFKSKVSVESFDYDLEVTFNNFGLTSFMRFYQSYENVQQNILDEDDIMLSFDSLFLYHKYLEDNSDTYNRFKVALDEQRSYGSMPDLTGFLDGRLKINRSPKKPNFADLLIRNFQFSDIISFDQLDISTAFIDSRQEQFSINIKNFSYLDDMLEEFKLDLNYFSDLRTFESNHQFIHYKGQNLTNPFKVSYSLPNKYLDFSFDFMKNQSMLIAFFSPSIASIVNEGQIRGRINGPLDNLNLSSDLIKLSDFRLTFDSKRSIFDSQLHVPNYMTSIKDNQLNVDKLFFYWKGQDTFRKVTRAERQNSFLFMGNIRLELLDFIDRKKVITDYDLTLKPTYLSINFPNFYSGDVRLVKTTSLVGKSEFSLSKKQQKLIPEAFASTDEDGPLLTSKMIFLDGVFNIGNFRSKKSKMKVNLDLDVTIGPGTFVQGSIFGDGIFNLANNIYLEVDKSMEKKPIKVGGSLKSIDIDATIDFYEGSITIFDGVYQLLRSESQLHYYQELPELISPQQIQIRPVSIDGVSRLSFDMSLRALRIKDYNVSTENIRDEEFPYQAIGLVIDGPIADISSGFKVLDYGLNSYTASYPTYMFYGQYDINFTSQQNFTSQTYYGLNLVMPSIVSDNEDTTFAQFGRQQINNFIKSSIRPYERRLARRIGLYDLRIDYDFGRTLFYNDQDLFTNKEDLLGINFISDLYDERLLLDLRADINLSSEEVNDHLRGVKVTQLELRYQVSNNFSVGLKNINEYSDITEFDPRFSLNYGYSF